MQRISDFILVEEINKTIVKRLDKDQSRESVDIRKGNFHWGPKLAKDKSKTDPKKNKKKDADEIKMVEAL